jgi:hypothetical protein
VSASSYRKGHEPAAVLDGDPNTRWEADTRGAGQWIQIDLGRECLISSYELSWYRNEKRAFKIELSDDDRAYQSSLEQPGGKTSFENNLRVPAQAVNRGRYVRITFTSNDRAVLEDVRIHGIVPGDGAGSNR